VGVIGAEVSFDRGTLARGCVVTLGVTAGAAVTTGFVGVAGVLATIGASLGVALGEVALGKFAVGASGASGFDANGTLRGALDATGIPPGDGTIGDLVVDPIGTRIGEDDAVTG
jgi:hypothetical protein